MSEETKRLSMLVYDGINIFYKGTWTGLEFDSVEEGQHVLGFLETLTDEQIEHWIRVQKYLKDSNKTFNALKYNKKYTGQTTCYPHIRSNMANDEKWKDTPGAGNDCIQAVNVFDVQWSNCPVEVEKEVKKLWRDMELGNDVCYHSWDGSNDNDGEDSDIHQYPIIAEYLNLRGIKKCLIHWWW